MLQPDRLEYECRRSLFTCCLFDPEDGETVVKAVNLMMANTVLFQAYKKLTGKQQQEVMAAIRDTNRVAGFMREQFRSESCLLEEVPGSLPAAFEESVCSFMGKCIAFPKI